MTIDTIIAAVAGLAGSVLVFLGARNTARVARESNDRKTGLEEFRTQLIARDELIDTYKEDVKELTTKIEALHAIQHSERVLIWWAQSVLPILRSSGATFPTPPSSVLDDN